ncbi:hypothetical protein [Clostridium perfringens]|uniref:hypothetical protein n=1 Tax=Clostridium perfringens TaxID=1502 RepID=UPI0021A5E849|nr:hypothetical protein [Clostridium perfringens]
MSKFYDEAIKKLDYDKRPLSYLKCSFFSFCMQKRLLKQQQYGVKLGSLLTFI